MQHFRSTMTIQDKMDRLDKTIFTAILADMSNGSLYTEADNETLHMVLEMINHDKIAYQSKGVIIGEA